MIKLEIEVTEEVGEELKKAAKKHLLTPEMEAALAVSNYAANMAKKAEGKSSLADFLISLAPVLVGTGQKLKDMQKGD
jgi:hypothetical protein